MIKKILALSATIISYLMFYLSLNAYELYNERYVDDYLLLTILSIITFVECKFKAKTRLYSYLKSLIAFWVPVSSIFHLVTAAKDLSLQNLYFYALFIVASILLFLSLSVPFFFIKKQFNPAYNLALSTAGCTIWSILAYCYGNISSGICIFIYAILICAELFNNNTTNYHRDINCYNPIYRSLHIKLLACASVMCVVTSLIYFFRNTQLLFQYTRPSAFLHIISSVSCIPVAIWLMLCTLGSHVSSQTKSKLLLLESFIAAVPLFFDLRHSYFDVIFTDLTIWLKIFILIFFASTYCCYTFNCTRALPVIAGTVCLSLLPLSNADADSVKVFITILAVMSAIIYDIRDDMQISHIRIRIKKRTTALEKN